MIIKKVFQGITPRNDLIVTGKRWLLANVGEFRTHIGGIKPNSLYKEEYWSTPEAWAAIFQDFNQLTGDYDTCDYLVLEYGDGWSMAITNSYDGMNKSLTHPEYKVVFVIDDDIQSVVFKLVAL
jgi:hypothetical protein